MNLLNSLIPSSNCQPSCETRSSTETAATVRPAYELHETTEAWALTVQLPGVDKANLELSVDDEQIRVFGRRVWKTPEGWTALYRESSDAAFELLINHNKSVDAEKVHAELKDGILRASLPKVSAIKPRKIAIA